MSLNLLLDLFQENPAIQLVKLPYAPYLLDFLRVEFLEAQKTEVIQDDLCARLSLYVEDINERFSPEGEGRGSVFGESIPALKYIQQWVDKGVFRRIRNEQREPTLIIQPAIQKLIRFLLEDLKEREFVGTACRFGTILEYITRLYDAASTSPTGRIDQINEQIEKLNEEKNKLIRTGEMAPLATIDAQDIITTLETECSILAIDFTGIEEQYRRFISSMVAEMKTRGDLVSRTLDFDKSINESSQGLSYAIFKNLLDDTDKMEDIRTEISLLMDDTQFTEFFLKDSPVRSLFKRIYQSDDRIRRVKRQILSNLKVGLNRDWSKRFKAARHTIGEIKDSARRLSSEVSFNDDFLELDLPSFTFRNTFPLEMYPWDGEERKEVVNAFEEAEDTGEFSNLNFHMLRASLDKLRENIDEELFDKDEISLADLLIKFPLKFGIYDIMGYIHIAKIDPHHLVDESISSLSIPSENSKKNLLVTLPNITFVNPYDKT